MARRRAEGRDGEPGRARGETEPPCGVREVHGRRPALVPSECAHAASMAAPSDNPNGEPSQCPECHRIWCTPSARARARDREIVRLAIPAFGALVAEPLYVLADTAIVGHLGRTPLGGLGVAGAVLSA